MDATSELAVTLSDELYAHLRQEAEELELPVEWLVASLVVDTIEDTETALEPALA